MSREQVSASLCGKPTRRIVAWSIARIAAGLRGKQHEEEKRDVHFSCVRLFTFTFNLP